MGVDGVGFQQKKIKRRKSVGLHGGGWGSCWRLEGLRVELVGANGPIVSSRYGMRVRSESEWAGGEGRERFAQGSWLPLFCMYDCDGEGLVAHIVLLLCIPFRDTRINALLVYMLYSRSLRAPPETINATEIEILMYFNSFIPAPLVPRPAPGLEQTPPRAFVNQKRSLTHSSHSNSTLTRRPASSS